MSNERRILAISRKNPATQKRERPWRNRAHEFSVTEPHSSREVLTQNYADALAMVQAGSSIRMSDGRGAPTLVSPLSLRISKGHGTAIDQLWFYTMPKPRFTRGDLEADIRKTIAGIAFEIFTLAGQKAADAFLGMRFDGDEISATSANIKLRRSEFARLILAAYESAFRDGKDQSLTVAEREQVSIMIAGTFSAAKRNWLAPVDDHGSPIRQTMLCSHWRPLIYQGKLFKDSLVACPPIERLTVLSGMTEAGVRNALSKFGIPIPQVAEKYEETINWLQSTRGFVPLREDERDGP